MTKKEEEKGRLDVPLCSKENSLQLYPPVLGKEMMNLESVVCNLK